MTFVIASACIDVLDQSCIEVCPVDCIYAEDEDRMCYIEPNDCIDCGLCESACPVGAILMNRKCLETHRNLRRLTLSGLKIRNLLGKE